MGDIRSGTPLPLHRAERLVERLQGKRGLQVVGERRADNLARERVDDDGEIDEVLGEPNVGDVGDSELIEAGGTKAAGERCRVNANCPSPPTPLRWARLAAGESDEARSCAGP